MKSKDLENDLLKSYDCITVIVKSYNHIIINITQSIFFLNRHPHVQLAFIQKLVPNVPLTKQVPTIGMVRSMSHLGKVFNLRSERGFVLSRREKKNMIGWLGKMAGCHLPTTSHMTSPRNLHMTNLRKGSKNPCTILGYFRDLLCHCLYKDYRQIYTLPKLSKTNRWNPTKVSGWKLVTCKLACLIPHPKFTFHNISQPKTLTDHPPQTKWVPLYIILALPPPKK